MKKMGQQARDACAVGQHNEAGMKIEQLMQLLSLATDLVAAAPSLDSISTVPERSSPLHFTPSTSSTGLSPPEVPGLAPNQFASVDSGSIKPDAVDLQGNSESRKRCASSLPIGDDRVNKALKREPQDDMPLNVSTTTSPPSLQPGALFPSSGIHPPTVDPRSITSYNPPSQPPSQPPSPPNLMPGFESRPSQPHSAPPFPQVSNTQFNPDFDRNSTTPTRTPVFPTGAGNRSSWSDGPSSLPQRQHPHSLSSGSLKELQGVGVPSYSKAVPFSSPAQPLRPTASSPASNPPIGRVSRTGSVSSGFVSPFAHGFPDIATQQNRPPNSDAYEQSRPSTGRAGHHSGDSSENDYDSDSDLEESNWSPSRGIHSRPDTSHDGTCQAGTDNSGGTGSYHRDDVPQEYKEEVDRVFFEFLNKICSNCKCLLHPRTIACVYSEHSGCCRFERGGHTPDSNGEKDATTG
jgi:hypothetical protein